MLVRLERDWEYSDLMPQTPNGDGRWGDLVVTEEPVTECDLLVVLNSPRRNIRVRVPEGNKWLFSQESPIEHYRWHRNSFKYFDRIFTFWDDPCSERITHDQTAPPWVLGCSYTEMKALSKEAAIAAKRDAVSWVTSNAMWKQGHHTRMGFKDFLLEQGFAFELFGRGFTPVRRKFDALFPYKYSIAIENDICDHYWTEKIGDCFLSWTVPIYCGAPNIHSYFPKESMILIDPSDPPGALQAIRSAMENDHFGKHIEAIAEARRLVLDEYQFFPHLERLVSQSTAGADKARERAFIPANPQHYVKSSKYGLAKIAIKSALQRWTWQMR